MGSSAQCPRRSRPGKAVRHDDLSHQETITPGRIDSEPVHRFINDNRHASDSVIENPAPSAPPPLALRSPRSWIPCHTSRLPLGHGRLLSRLPRHV